MSVTVSGGQSSSFLSASGTNQISINDGGTATSSYVVSGGYLVVSSGGAVFDSNIATLGTEYIEPGAVATGDTLSGSSFASAIQYVGAFASGAPPLTPAASAFDTTVEANGVQFVSNGGVTFDTAVEAGGKEYVYFGTASGTEVNGGYLLLQALSAGPVSADNTAVNADGIFFVNDGGVALNTTISGTDAKATFGSGSFASDTTVESGGLANISGSATNLTIDSGGSANVDYYGPGNNGTNPNGTVNGEIVNSGGYETISGGTVNNASVNGGGTVFVDSNGNLNHATVSSGGIVEVSSGGIASNPIIDSGGLMIISSGGVVFYPIVDSGGTLEILPGGILECFAGGTQILTVRGEVAVEDLQETDIVPAIAGGCVRRVRWVGHRHTSIKNHPRPQEVRPVRVRKDAFGPNLPDRDLVLSPQHAIYVKGDKRNAPMLVPVRHLLNGVTILQESVDQITYYHVELADEAGDAVHDVVLAHGLAVESYLDTGGRHAFENTGAPAMLHPDFGFAAWEARGCAELVLSGPRVNALAASLATQARTLGHSLTEDSDLYVMANGWALDPEITGREYRFILPAGVRDLRIISRHFVPARMLEDCQDERCLGVAITNLTLDGANIPLNDPRLIEGWHQVENEWRWSCGDAGLRVDNATVLTITLAPWAISYWQNAHSTGHFGIDLHKIA